MTNIKITAGNVTIPATLNETVAAKDFITRLPVTVNGSNSGIDICCTLTEGKFNSVEKQTGWKNGDINVADGWLALLYGGQEQSDSYPGMMIVGHIANEYLDAVANFPASTIITVELA
ncbi:MAG: cyclophilin-like fold protein [Candidatus Metalachnospira sp.]|nr:cyclophilin-like fold protein [Candidatus Metalachnospira sp.]